MNIDPAILAAQISDDLAPSDFPEDLCAVADDDLIALHLRVVSDVNELRNKVSQYESLPDCDQHELARFVAILKLKFNKSNKVEKELDRRDRLVPMGKALHSLSYEKLLELNLLLQKKLRDTNARQKTLTGLREPSPTDLADLRRVNGSLKRRKSEYHRLLAEFKRRKRGNLDAERFIVRRASADPAELEAYLAEARAEHPHWWPTTLLGMGDHVLVVWKTKEAPPDEDDENS